MSSLKTIFRPFHDADQIEGTTSDRTRNEHARAVREARLNQARRQTTWREIPEPVTRGRYLVDADSDLVYVHRRGHVFQPGTATIAYVNPDTPLTYYVKAGEVVFVGQAGGRRTWTQVCERQARRGTTA